MGVRPSRYVLSGLAVLAAPHAAHAVVKTQVVSSGTISSALAYTPPLFDTRNGTLLKVAVDADYEGTTGFYYPGLAAIAGGGAVSGSATFGSLSFGLNGTTQITDTGSGRGIFAVSALGTGTWTNAADLARFTASGQGQLSTRIQGSTPGTPMSGGLGPTVNYRVTYTYDDGTPAVPEPATWEMMGGGFVLIGVALRAARRRRPEAASEAPRAS